MEECEMSLDDTVRAYNAIEKAKASIDGHIGFEGFNCRDIGNDCKGWDGKSRRCDCGNRRVSWVWDDVNPSFVWAEAW
jgi:hypothetical protein